MSATASRPRARAPVKRLLLGSAAGRWVLVPYRLGLGLNYFRAPFSALAAWLFTSREIDNYTYDLTERNKAYLASFVGLVAGVDAAIAAGYIAELDADHELREHVRLRTAASPGRHAADPVPRYGRRAGWYAMVRARKPRVVVETGVSKGLGTCVLAAAVLRNVAEGHPGTVIGTDIDPGAGALLAPPYDRVARIAYGDSIESLRALDVRIDLFINDSDHSAEYEAREYETVAPRLERGAVLLGDNAHATDALCRFALSTGRRFLFFQEEPERHWYPGAGIGFAF